MNLYPRNTLIILAGLALAAGATGCGRPVEEDSSLSVKAPDFELQNFAGGKTRLSDYRGKVIFLNFWATRCPPCRMEIPDLVDLYKNYSDRGLVILGISTDQNPNRVLGPFIRGYKINYPILFGTQEQLFRVSQNYGGIIGIPTSFLIDRQGVIRNRYLGLWPKSVFEEKIKELLAGETTGNRVDTDE